MTFDAIITTIMVVIGVVSYTGYKLSGASWNYINWSYFKR